ncbi:hypothetical protein CBR65_05420 [Cellvibrio sp. PSBB006]|nr:hypothetical protein CBR65_05420 [Cellvibrio sp. PSBB006]
MDQDYSCCAISLTDVDPPTRVCGLVIIVTALFQGGVFLSTLGSGSQDKWLTNATKGVRNGAMTSLAPSCFADIKNC